MLVIGKRFGLVAAVVVGMFVVPSTAAMAQGGLTCVSDTDVTYTPGLACSSLRGR